MIPSIIRLYSICTICFQHRKIVQPVNHLVAQMNPVGGNNNGVGGSDVPLPPRQEQIQDAAGLAEGVDPEMLRNITRDKM